MSMRVSFNVRTVCEVLREINDMHQKDDSHDNKVRMLLREAQTMAKKITGKLFEYNQEFDKGFWEANPDMYKDIRRRLDTDYLEGPKPENVPSALEQLRGSE